MKISIVADVKLHLPGDSKFLSSYYAWNFIKRYFSIYNFLTLFDKCLKFAPIGLNIELMLDWFSHILKNPC